MEKRNLKLVLKYKWYDMIEAGLKDEEYRDIKQGIVGLLFDWKKSKLDRKQFTRLLQMGNYRLFSYLKDFDNIEFFRGYQRDRKTMIVEFKKAKLGTARPEISDNWKGKVFVLSLGEIITKNE